MPLVRIDMFEGRSDEEIKELADTVQDCLLDVFASPPGDRYQVITEHRPGRMFLEDTGLGYTRTDRVVVLQITQQNRDTAQKQALYAALAERLEARVGLRPQDLIVSVVASTPEDWSFGEGRAQFLTEEL